MKLPAILQNCIAEFSKLPGVGEKTATRQCLVLSRWKLEALKSFGEAIQNLSELIHCEECGAFSDESRCAICTDEHRRQSGTLCIVEDIADCIAIENSGQYQGLFHVLGGVLNPIMGIGPENLRLGELSRRIKELELREVILAVNPSVEGDATCSYIKDILTPLDIEVQRIGFGIPIGGHLEYLDPLTISKALENRRLI